MKLFRLTLLGVLLSSPALAAPVVPPTVFDAAGNPIRTNPVITVDTTGAYVAGGGGAYTGPLASQLPASLGAKAGASSLSVVPSTDTPFPSVGNIASGAADSGNPIKIGGVYRATPPTFADGQRGDAALSSRGALSVFAVNGSAPTDATGNSAAYFVDSAGAARPIATFGGVFNGTTWDRQRGDATGTWVGGHASLNTGQVSIGTSSTLVAAARTGRQKIILSVGAANTCAFGNTGVTTTTGFPLQPTAGASLTLDTSAAIYAACSATTTVSFLEQY